MAPEFEPVREDRILALDLGQRRIGLAVSDPLRLTAQGLETLQRANNRQDFAALAKLISQWNVSLLLIGYPLRMSGEEGRQAQSARLFADSSQCVPACPIDFGTNGSPPWKPIECCARAGPASHAAPVR